MKSKSRQQAVGSRSSVAGRPLPVALLPIPGCRLQTTGFTLVEMLVALALVSTIVTMVYGSLMAASRSLDLYGSRMACDDRACLVLRLMARQLRCVYLPPLDDPVPPSAPNDVPSARLTSLAAEPLEAGSEGLRFVTTAGLDTGPALSRVLYRHDPATGILSICCEPYLAGAEAAQSPGSWRPLLARVRSVEVQFYDGQQWQPGWTGASQTLPRSVKIALTIIDEKNRLHEFTTTVPIGCRRASLQQQITTRAGKL